MRIEVSVKASCRFPIYLRVPAWCTDFKAVCAGETASVKDSVAKIEREWHTGDVIEISLPMTARATEWFHQSRAVEYGPLLMALPIAEEWRVTKGRRYVSDYEVWPESEWNWALVDGGDLSARHIEKCGEAGFTGEAPVKLKVSAVRAPEWGMDGASCANPPIGMKYSKGAEQEIELVPYGIAKLHVAQFPVAKAE